MRLKSIRIHENTFNRLKSYSLKSGLPMSTAINFAVNEFIDRKNIERSDKYIKTCTVKDISMTCKSLLSQGFIIVSIVSARKKGILFNIEYTNK